jgi:hypothetical protein
MNYSNISIKDGFESALKRAKRLLLPYVVFSLTYKILKALISAIGFFSWSEEFPTSVEDLLLSISQPLAPQLYFLPYLFCIWATVYILHLAFRRTEIVFFFVFSIFIPFYLLTDVPPSAYGSDVNLIPMYLVGFVFGCYESSANKMGKTLFLQQLFLQFLYCVLINKVYFLYISSFPSFYYLYSKG